MDRPWQRYAHLGIVFFMIYPEIMGGEGPVVERARKIAEDDFFNVIEITNVKDEAARRELKQMFDVAHLEVGFGAQPGLLMNKLNLAALDDEARGKAVAQVKTSIDQAYFYGARILSTLDGPASFPGEAKADEAKAQLAKSLKELCQYAKDIATDYTMSISLETFDRDVDKKSLLGPSTESAAFAKGIRSEYDNFGLTLDLSHLPLLKEGSAEALDAVKDEVIHIHVGNAAYRDANHPAFGDMHPRFGIAGGENDVHELTVFLRELFNIKFFDKKLPTRMPVVTFEVRPVKGEAPELVIANTKRVWREAWAKV